MAKQQPKPAPKEAPKQKHKSKSEPHGPSFLNFLIAKEQRMDWAIIGGLFMAILIFLKIYYPYPQTESDSGNYILSAFTGKINGYRPFGYSGWLAFFHNFSPDVKFVVTWQWFLTFLSVTLFLFTIKFIFRSLPKVAFYILIVLCILNPSMIYMDAYMMSDSLFISLTMLYLTACIWIIYNRSWIPMLLSLLLLWWCMDARYIGLFYPIFSAAAIGWALWYRFRWLGLAGGLLPLILLYVYQSQTTATMKEEFGVETFSAFGGWQKANNGVSVLPYVKIDPNEISDPQTKAIHQIVSHFPDSCFRTNDIMMLNFMWIKDYPGKRCLYEYIQQTGTPYVKAWVYMGAQMGAYGDFLQSHYRMEYIKHFIIPNFFFIFKVYPIEEYKEFNADANMKSLFTSDRDNYHYTKEWFRPLTPLRAIFDAVMWVVLISSIIGGLLMIRKLNWSLEQKLIVGLFIVFIGAFCGASTIAAPIMNFRYMMTVYYAQLVIPILIISAIISSRKASN